MVAAIRHQVFEVGSSEPSPALQQSQTKPPTSLDSSVSCEGLDKIIIGEDEERYFHNGIRNNN